MLVSDSHPCILADRGRRCSGHISRFRIKSQSRRQRPIYDRERIGGGSTRRGNFPRVTRAHCACRQVCGNRKTRSKREMPVFRASGCPHFTSAAGSDCADQRDQKKQNESARLCRRCRISSGVAFTNESECHSVTSYLISEGCSPQGSIGTVTKVSDYAEITRGLLGSPSPLVYLRSKFSFVL